MTDFAEKRCVTSPALLSAKNILITLVCMSDFEWTGRVDGPGSEHARWHSVIQTDLAVSTAAAEDDRPSRPGVALIGFASDEGVRRNGGRQGAAAGPDELRTALGGLAIHDDVPRYDTGTVTYEGRDLEAGQEELSQRVAATVRAGHLPVILGGGHETAFASHRGLVRGLKNENPDGLRDLGIFNLDAHFDLRDADEPTSGTPFRQISEIDGENFSYTVWGISKANNTRVLFETADRLGVNYLLDEDLARATVNEVTEIAHKAAQDFKNIHLSIDLDVLPASVAPGVSAPAALGVEALKVHAMALALAQTGKLRLVDVVELNPKYDVDSRTAKLAARMIHDIVVAHGRAVV